jgi:type II secretory pathway pseudopilin PulG
MKSRTGEQGFALLFVFAMAAIIAITLYVAMPRITFEAQRDKEALLIERGEQYKRGIQLYVRKFKRFPAKMEDLDNANGIRFLRHHYKDPMTGKEEWRLIHAGPGGVLLDSLVKPLNAKDKKAAAQSSITELLGVGGLPEADASGNLATRKRPSDIQGAPGTGVPGAFAPGAPIPPDATQGNFPNPNPFPGAQAGSLGPAGANSALPGRFPPTTNPAGSAVNSQTGGISAGPAMGSLAPDQVPSQLRPNQVTPGQTAVPGLVTNQINNPFAAGGANPNAQGATEAARLIGSLLTTPRPGGLNGIQQQQSAGNQTIGGGIAGVASTVKTGSGIKIYNDQDEYKKWEFVYDAAKDTQGAQGVPQQGRAPGTPIGQPAAGAVGGNVFGAPAPPPATPPK